jgi:hypothetical protein
MLCDPDVAIVLLQALTEMVLYGADKAVIVYILHSELYRIIILPNNTIIIPSISLLPHL